jgi:PmbA protein
MAPTIDLESSADRAVRTALRFGAQRCDAVSSEGKRISAEVERRSVKQADSLMDSGVGIRAIVNGAAGFAYCTGLDAIAIDAAAKRAVSMARAGTPDPSFLDLPSDARPAKVKGLFDKRVERLQPDEIVGLVMEMDEVAGDDRRIHSVNADIALGQGRVHLSNSNGVSHHQEMTYFEATCYAVAKAGREMFSGYDMVVSRRFDHSAIEDIGATAREHAIMGLKHTKVKTGHSSVVMDPLAFGFVLATALGRGADAEAVQRNRSYLAGKMGSTIGSEILSVSDDPTLEWGVGSFSFDGEGIPARKKALVDSGRLATYLYDSYTAGKDSVSSTGNSSRGHALWSYRQPPVISSTNLVVERGEASTREMIEDTKDGIYLRVTFDYPNLATGEFSGLMMESYKIVKGELGPSIRQATMGIGMTELYSNMDLVGNEARGAFGVVTPPVRVPKVRIAGSV